MKASWQKISDKKLWEKSLLENSAKNFLQASSFGDFHEKLGDKVWRFGIISSEKIVSFAQVIKKRPKIGSFLYIPWGPILDEDSDLNSLIEVLADLAKKAEASFVRLEPRVELGEWRKVGLKRSPSYTQPQCSLLLDLTKSQEDLRKDLSESTRYNINMSLRRGVKIRKVDTSEIDVIKKLLKSTAKKKKLVLQKEQDYHKDQYEILHHSGLMEMFVAEYEKEILAAALVVFYGKTAYYLHAANSYQHSNLRVSYPLVWQTIVEAKARGFGVFDFWGIAKDDNPNDSWAGVTAFKKSFGGEKVCYPRPYDLVISNKYYLLILADKIRVLLRLFRK